jgi:PAS domain S-box-containing protein
MDRKSTYEELVLRIEELEKESANQTRTTETLREHYSVIEDILEKAAEGICVCHNVPEEPYVRFTHWNPRMTEITGYTMEEINRLGWYQSVYPDAEVQRRAMDRMARMRVGDDIKREEWVITTRGGEKRTLSISTSVAREGDGRTHVLAIMQDVTERKRADEALRSSEEKYKLLAEQSADVIYKVALKNDQYTYANPSAQKILGYTSKEISSLRVMDVLTAKSYEKQRNAMLEALASGSRDSAVLELEAVHKDGHTIPIEAHARFILDEQGRPVEIQGVARDITDRKRAEEALRKAHEDLEIRVEERTSELKTAKQELEAQRSKLEEVNIALRVLLERREAEKVEVEKSMLFNIRQLILPYLEKLKKTGLNDRQATLAEILEANLSEVISPFSRRLSSSELSFTPSEIKVAALIRQGQTSKEIAELFDVSLRTIEAHRENIRKKIGIKQKKGNLRTLLLSMD